MVDRDGGEEHCKRKFYKQLNVLLETMYGGKIRETADPGKVGEKKLIPDFQILLKYVNIQNSQKKLTPYFQTLPSLEIFQICEYSKRDVFVN